MMKIYSKILTIMIGTLFFTACNNMLDLDSDGHVSTATIFENRNSTMGYLSSCYDYREGLSLDMSSYTDEAQDCKYNTSGSAFDYWYNVGLTVDNYASYSYDGLPWVDYYEGIRKCNVFLTNMPTATAYTTDDEKEGWMAQAYTLRAFYYLELFKRYGKIPLITKDLGTNYDYSKATKAKVGDVVKQILADCDSALAVNESEDFSWNIYDKQQGIMTRGIAYAIKSEAITYAISPLFDDGTYTWKDALDITKDALYQCLTHDYSLFTKTSSAAQNAYALYFMTTPYDKRTVDKETIYAIDSELSAWQNAGLPSNSGVLKSGPCPSQELIDCYETTDGEPVLDLTNPYSDADHLEPNYNKANTLYNQSNPYANRDPRFDASIYYNGSVRYLNKPTGTKVQTYVGGTEGISQTSITHTKTGYYIRKYNNYNSSKSSNSDGWIRIFRLAELYMNFAEAAYQSDDNTPDTEINIGGSMYMSGRDAVDAIRERAGMPDLPTGLSNDEFQNRYRNERRVEFAFEGQRFFDARRWKILDNFKVITGMNITVSGSNTTYSRFKFDDRVTTIDKYLLYPLSRSEVTKMLELTGSDWQNSGWD